MTFVLYLIYLQILINLILIFFDVYLIINRLLLLVNYDWHFYEHVLQITFFYGHNL